MNIMLVISRKLLAVKRVILFVNKFPVCSQLELCDISISAPQQGQGYTKGQRKVTRIITGIKQLNCKKKA